MRRLIAMTRLVSSISDVSSVSSSDMTATDFDGDSDDDIADLDIRPLSAGDTDDIQRTTHRDLSSAYHHP